MQRLLLSVAAATLLFACKKPAAAFVGQWSCTGDGVIKYDASAGKPDSKVQTKGTRTFSSDGTSLTSTYVDSMGKDNGCVAQWTVSGTTATLKPGPDCTVKAIGGVMVSKTTSATANLTGASLQESYVGTFSGTQTNGITTSGSISGSYSCTRK